jgi:hypothetical protein
MAEHAEPNPIVFFDVTLGGQSHHHSLHMHSISNCFRHAMHRVYRGTHGEFFQIMIC